MGRFEPTSQVCSQCGVKDCPKPQHARIWTCRACRAVLDQDINAAVNVAKASGLAVSARGAQARPGLVPPPAEWEPSSRSTFKSSRLG
ncbi:zinc ribbon domain-containing protein [Actinacidiphila glaucinigra]|uniref:zinc ribbon domain-containing protein n=1 Tax=Actinacidiphila glaucinigra TaxID=235986 RepID=UPI0036C36C0A